MYENEGGDRRLMTKESIMKYLEEVFGIKSESELNAAVASAEKLKDRKSVV